VIHSYTETVRFLGQLDASAVIADTDGGRIAGILPIELGVGSGGEEVDLRISFCDKSYFIDARQPYLRLLGRWRGVVVTALEEGRGYQEDQAYS
jgi:hypothetical protein